MSHLGKDLNRIQSVDKPIRLGPLWTIPWPAIVEFDPGTLRSHFETGAGSSNIR